MSTCVGKEKVKGTVPIILVNAQQMKENLFLWKEKIVGYEYTRNTFILRIQYKCSVYIISSSYRIIDIVCVCLCRRSCGGYKTVNSSTDSTV